MWETQVQSLSREDHLEREMATHSSILAWEIPWTGEPGALQSTGSQESDMTERLNDHNNNKDLSILRLGHPWGILEPRHREYQGAITVTAFQSGPLARENYRWRGEDTDTVGKKALWGAFCPSPVLPRDPPVSQPRAGVGCWGPLNDKKASLSASHQGVFSLKGTQ